MAGLICIRPMELPDLERALAIEEASYKQPWTEGIFRDELGTTGRVYLVAEEGQHMVGFGGLMLVDNEAHLTTVVVRPDRRGTGVGTRLTLALVEAGLAAGARSLTLEVRVSNKAAQALYQRFGMAPVGVRKHYYLDEDALIMWAHDIHLPEFTQRLQEIKEGLEVRSSPLDHEPAT